MKKPKRTKPPRVRLETAADRIAFYCIADDAWVKRNLRKLVREAVKMTAECKVPRDLIAKELVP